jgi:Cu/Zn superoxide dismutase
LEVLGRVVDRVRSLRVLLIVTGGHFNPDGKKHGLMATEGHHAGDMPNLHPPRKYGNQ